MEAKLNMLLRILHINKGFLKDRISGKLLVKFFATENERQKDSNWIYSSKYDEMKSMYKGKIFVTTDTGNNL